MGFAEVAVGVPLETTFHYTVPAALARSVVVGRRVRVPFGKRRATGWVVGVPDALPAGGFGGELKAVEAALDDGPLLSPDELELYKWIASYYQHPLGLTLKAAVPAGLDKDRVKPKTERVFVAVKGTGDDPGVARALRAKAAAQGAVLEAIVTRGELPAAEVRDLLGPKGTAAAAQLVKKGLVAVRHAEVMRSPLARGGADLIAHEPASPPPLTPEQDAALAAMTAALDGRTFSPVLLQGVTGSGKTEVYLRAIRSALDRGRSALVLVPEIALTPQLVGRFRARFGDGIAVLHSGLSDGERFDEWRRIRRGDVKIAVGARSAVFAPMRDLGILVVDEEHDGSYKQEEGLRYHARDVAVVRAQRAGAVVVLGSATPSLETWQNAKAGRYARLLLSKRVGERPLPPVEVVSLAGGNRKQRKGPLSPRLEEAIRETLAARQQAILFLNRRGYAPSVVCDDCGHVFRCQECSVAMIFHAPGLAKKAKRGKERSLFDGVEDEPGLETEAKGGWLACHYCGRRANLKESCPECRQPELKLLGVGTQRLERELKELFPDARVARMDRDTTSRRGSHEEILKRLAKGEIDLLLGTQMIAKGLDFPGVTLVGVVLADTTLNLADFRAAERTFQLLTQVSGRAGRGELPGRVIVQTFHPSHYAVSLAATHDFEAFAEREADTRRDLFYPPFSRLLNVRIHGVEKSRVERTALLARSTLDDALRGENAARVVGPAPAPLSMIRGRHRWQVMVRATSAAAIRRAARVALSLVDEKRGGALRVEVDVDPQSLL